MTATVQATRTGIPPATWARWVAFGFVAVNLAIVEMVFISSGAGKNSLLTVAKFVGLHAALFMMFQLLLVARLPWLERRIGMDRLTVWHRWLGFGLLWTVLTHATLVVLGYSQLGGNSPVGTFFDLAGVFASLLGILAATGLVAVVLLSIRYARRRLPYEVWHATHLLVYVVLGLALWHQFLESTTFTATTLSTVYWWGLWALVLFALVTGRVAIPLWRNAHHQFRVAAVVPEADNVVSVHVTGRHLDRLPGSAGQFCVWRFPGHRFWWKANPFSLSAAPNGKSLRLTAKAVGDGSAGLRQIPVGTRVFLEGPYGALTSLNRCGTGAVLVAGGIGVTLIRALLEELDGPIVVLYRVRTLQEAVLLSEIQALARANGAQVHVLTGRTGEGSPPNNPFDPARLAALVPDIVQRDIYICGPTVMADAVMASMKAIGVPRRQVHAEKFSLA